MMESIIKELWHGNIIPQDDSRNNSKEMKDLISYMARHHDDLLKDMTDAQKEIFEKFDDCWSEYTSLAEEAIFCHGSSWVQNLCLRCFQISTIDTVMSRVSFLR